MLAIVPTRVRFIPQIGCAGLAAVLIGLCAAGTAAQAQVSATPTTINFTVTVGSSGFGKPVGTTPLTQGTIVTLAASVGSSKRPPLSGTVNFCDVTAKLCTDIHKIGAGQITDGGPAKLRIEPGPGAHSYVAVFLPSNGYAAASSNVAIFSVTGEPTVTTLATPTETPGDYTLTSTVTGNTEQPLSGAVSFEDQTSGNAVLGTATLGTPSTPMYTVETGQSFGTGASQPGVTSGASVVGDFNNDGKLDVIAVSPDSSVVYTYLGNGDGTFQAPFVTNPGITDVTNIFSLTAIDIDNDGYLDLILTQATSSDVYYGNWPSPSNVYFTEWLMKGGLAVAVGSYPLNPNATTYNPVVADFNGDGFLDLAFGNTQDVTGTSPVSSNVQIFLNNRESNWNQVASITVPSAVGKMATADVNGDGIPDLILPDDQSNTVNIFLGKGDGSFIAGNVISVAGGPNAVALADLNGDGKIDLVVGGASSSETLLGDGAGGFTPEQTLPYPHVFDVKVADLNGDGFPDAVLMSDQIGKVQLLLNDGTGVLLPAAPSPISVADYTEAVAVGDLNGDGLSDFVTSALYNPSMTYLSQLSQSATATVSGISPTGVGTQLVFAHYGGNGVYASSNSNTVSLQGLDFSFTNQGVASQTVNPGDGTSFTFALAPLNGSYPGTVTFAASGLPSGTSYTISPVSVAAGAGPQTVTLQIQTAPTGYARTGARTLWPEGGAVLALLCPFWLRRRVKANRVVVMLLLVSGFSVSVLVSGCGGGYFQENLKSFPVTVTATSSGLQHAATVTLTIR